MNCKFCQAELEEGVTLCPVCGKENETEQTPPDENVPAEEEVLVEETLAGDEMPVEEVSAAEDGNKENGNSEQKTSKMKMTSGKLAAIYIGVIAVVAVLIAMVFFGMKGNSTNMTAGTEGTIPADGNADDVSCQGSYTVSDRKAKSKAKKVVATGENAELTNGELQVFYWLQVYNFMNNYGSYYEVDFSQPLDTQVCSLSENGWTWQQYFLNVALQDWQMYNAFCQEAAAVGFESTMDMDSYLESVRTSLEEATVTQGFDSVDDMVKADMGPGATLDSYMAYVEMTELGYQYYNDIYENTVPTEDQIRTYFEENSAVFAENGITDNGSLFVDVRHILIQPTQTDGAGGYTEEAWATCKEEAQKVLDLWLAGEKTEDSFAELANEYSVDPGSNTNGGLYQYVEEGDMVTEFNDWCFDASRAYGDYDLVKTTYGYHIMFYVKNQPVWYAYAEAEAFNAILTEKIDALMEKYAVDVDYSKIALGFVDQNAAS